MAFPFPSPPPFTATETDTDHIELHVGPAGELSANPKARAFRAMLTVCRPKVCGASMHWKWPLADSAGRRILSLPTNTRTRNKQATVWRVLTNYEDLASVLPNLAVSRREPLPPDSPHPNATGRVYQEGEQRLFGWKVPMVISTGVTLDFEEDEESGVVRAYMVESALLHEYRAEWRLKEEKAAADDNNTVVTRMHFSGVACPKGPVPQRLVEWQLRRDVPENLRALKAHAEAACEDDEFVLAAGGEEEVKEEEEEGSSSSPEEEEDATPQKKAKREEDSSTVKEEERVVAPSRGICCLPVRRLVSH